MTVLGPRRSAVSLLVCAALLGACSDEGLNPIVGAAIDEITPGEAPAAPAKATRVTREAINRADVATIRIRLPGDKQPSYMSAASDNGGFVTYASAFRQSLTLRGAQVTASRGLGFDLLSATSSQPDPLVRPIPPDSWPATVRRSYEFPAWAPQGEIQSFECHYERGAVRDIVILDQPHRGVEISETCTGPSGSFENLHFVDAGGTVWRSLQWLGPRQGNVDVEIVLPYTP